MKTLGAGLLIAVLLVLAGCQGTSISTTPYDGYRTTPADPRRDTDKAQKENARAVVLLRDGNLKEAEKALKDALTADIFFGPAHNNLGYVYQRQEDYYQAAWEFQYAAKLMPYKAEPCNNLGMLYESVGRLDESAKWYDEALSMEPGNVEVIGNMARLLAKTHKDKDRERKLLDEIILRDKRPEWVDWAKEERALLGGGERAPEERPAAVEKRPSE